MGPTGALECSVLVLAGGRSRRFGRDKLRLDWRGRTLRDHVVARMSELSDDVIVLAASDAGGEDPPPSGVRILRDAEAWPGPLVALGAGLAAVAHELAVLVAADMPLIPLRMVDLLLAEAAVAGRTIVGLDAHDELQPLPLAIHRTPVLAALEPLIGAGARRLGALRGLPGAHGIPEAVWRALDPHGDSLRDIDTEEDLLTLLSEPTED